MQYESLIASLVKSIPEPLWLTDTNEAYIACNSAFERLIGLQETDILGKTAIELPASRQIETGNVVDSPNNKGLELTETAITVDGQQVDLQIRRTPFFDQQGQVVGILGVARDITELKRQQYLLKASNQALESMVMGKPLPEILTQIVSIIEAQSPEMCCSILLLDEDGLHLRHGAAPSLPQAFSSVVDGLAIGPSVGSCGSAAFTGQPVFVDDIASHPFWQDFVDLARAHNLRACWSTPILSGTGAVLGTFAVYYQTPRTATPTDRELIANATHLAAVAIERYRATTTLDEQLTELRRWKNAMMDRETHTLDYKKEVNDLLRQLGKPPRYINLWSPQLPLDKPIGIEPFDTEDQVRRILLSVIEDQKLTEHALKESELRYRSLANNGRALIWTARTDKKCDYFNKTWLEFTGRSFVQEWGDGWTDGLHPDDFSECILIYSQAFDRRERFSMIYRLRRHDGEYRWIIDDGVPQYNQAGEFIGYLGYCLDITERIDAEKALKDLNATLEQRVQDRTSELVEANQELESFSYSVSHDLRAPLRAITGFTQILSRRHRDTMDEEAKHYLDNVLQASQRMELLIDDLLLYSRTGRSAIARTKINITPLMENIIMTFSKRIEAAGVHLELIEPLAEPMGDATLLSQIISNLIDNALTYRSTTKTPYIRICSSREADKVVIKISDNGIGISKEYYEKIFQVFQRLHTSDEFPGTGIGLAIVSKATRLMSGTVSLDSKLGQGSTFTVTLPAPEASAP